MPSRSAVTVRSLRHPALASLALAAALALALDARAQEKRTIRATDLYRIRTASDVVLSPDGRRLAFTVTQIDSTDNAYYSHIWIADVDGTRVQQYTRGSVRDRNPVWSPDGSQIAFVSSRGDDRSQVYILPTDGGEARPITELATGASDPAWAPDGARLVFTSRLTARELEREDAERGGGAAESNPGEEEAGADTAMWGSLTAIRNWLAANASEKEPAVITRLNFQGERELRPIERWSHIYVLDLNEKKPRRLTDGAYNFRRPTFSPDGRRIAFTTTITDGIHPDYSVKADLYIADTERGDRRKLEIPGYTILSAAFSPDGRSIAFAARDTAEPSAANTELGVIELASNEVRWLSRPLDRSVRQFRWTHDGEAIYFSAGVHGTVPIYRVKLEDGEIRQIVSGERGAISFDLARDRLAYAITEPANPSEIYTADADGDDERRLTDLNAGWLSAVQVQPHRGFWYRSFDGRRIQGWVIEPVGYEPGQVYPMVLEIHGGPHAMWGPGERTMWHEFQFLAANGYFVLYTNPRGSDGYGSESRLSIQRAWGEGPMRDVLTAVDTLVARGVVDEDRMVVTGGSYAGYLTAYLVGHDHRFKAAVAQRGVYDLATFFGEGNAWRLVPYEFDAYPWEDFEILRAESPISYAHQIQTPLLIMHSDRDLRTGVSQSEMLYRTLKVLRKPVEYVRYPRQGHDLSRTGEPKLRIDRLLRILEFFERYTH